MVIENIGTIKLLNRVNSREELEKICDEYQKMGLHIEISLDVEPGYTVINLYKVADLKVNEQQVDRDEHHSDIFNIYTRLVEIGIIKELPLLITGYKTEALTEHIITGIEEYDDNVSKQRNISASEEVSEKEVSPEETCEEYLRTIQRLEYNLDRIYTELEDGIITPLKGYGNRYSNKVCDVAIEGFIEFKEYMSTFTKEVDKLLNLLIDYNVIPPDIFHITTVDSVKNNVKYLEENKEYFDKTIIAHRGQIKEIYIMLMECGIIEKCDINRFRGLSDDRMCGTSFSLKDSSRLATIHDVFMRGQFTKASIMKSYALPGVYCPIEEEIYIFKLTDKKETKNGN